MSETIKIIGVMSGSSLDGLDVAECIFTWKDGLLDWKFGALETIPIEEKWAVRLKALPSQSAYDFVRTNVYFGHYMGEAIKGFIDRNDLSPDYIALHGHTIFHEPDKNLTVQIGDPSAVAAFTKCAVIHDFRSLDIALGGQGAPVAPIVDRDLLKGYSFYLNLGGIANISADVGGRFVAFDICPLNQVLNAFANKLGLPYDDNGEKARAGKVDEDFLFAANEIPFYKEPYPKSLGNNWIQKQVIPFFLTLESSWEDKLATAVEMMAQQIKNSVFKVIEEEGMQDKTYTVLVTGGGAFNGFLIERMRSLCGNQISFIIPDENIIHYKEALLMAYMGLLRVKRKPNCLKTVTGARVDNVGGGLYFYT